MLVTTIAGEQVGRRHALRARKDAGFRPDHCGLAGAAGYGVSEKGI